MNPIKFKIQLRDGERPDISVLKIKEMIKDDDYIHPSMLRTLTLLKKTRQPYIRLPVLKVMVLDLDNHVYFERSLKPESKAWIKWELDEHEIKDYESDKDGFVKRVEDMYNKYLKSDFYDVEQISSEELEMIYSLTKKKKDKTTPTKVKIKSVKMKR
ncbi:MAG: hypothetical protein EOL97_07100 [Spirochaetia bacterium]|nr:hypothetical protein [Spirochaetia bacterium]